MYTFQSRYILKKKLSSKYTFLVNLQSILVCLVNYEIMYLLLKRKVTPQAFMHNYVVGLYSFLKAWICHCLLPYIMYANNDGSGETLPIRRIFWALATRQCDK